jgi:hypothetical protein
VTADDLATLQITRVIFHDVPQRLKNSEQQPTLSEVESEVDNNEVKHLRDRIKRALGSPRAYEIEFDPSSGSPVPALVRELTANITTSQVFVSSSQKIARYLFEQQTGATSPGLLAVMDCVIQGEQSLAILKLEREQGAQLEFSQRDGKRTFDLEVLNNLILTDGTRFFKTALFHRKGEGDSDFSALACDDQLRPGSGDQMAQFWQRFLGSRLIEQPRVATKRFFEASMEYISDVITDPIVKTDVYEHVLSQLKAPKKTFAPKTFINEYIPEEHQQPFRVFLEERNVSLRQFGLDISEIEGKLRRKSYITPKGAVVTAPADEPDLVTVQKHRIIVNDTLSRVSKK